VTHGLQESQGQVVGIDLGADADGHRDVRAVVTDVDVPEHRDVALAKHIEDDFAEVRSALGELDLGGANHHPRDPVEHVREAQHVQVVPDRRGRRGRQADEV
jgi:hypothetical protein